MTAVVIVEMLVLVVLLGFSAFFSSAETALFSLNPIQVHRLRRSRPAVTAKLERLLALPNQLLSTILVGNTLVNVGAAALGYVVAEQLYPGYGEIVSIVVMTLLLVVFGEVSPKRLAMADPERMALAYTPALMMFVRLFAPLRVLLESSARLFPAPLRKKEPRTLTEDEFLTVVEVGEEEGVLDEEERTMVDGIIRLEDTQASDVMTPRVDLVGIDLDDPPEESRRIARSVKFRYLPVYRDTLDHVEGFLDVPHYLLADEPDLSAAMLPPYFVPETAPLDTLLTTFQREQRRVAFVVDEFGGTAGLLTRGDILEEIVADVDNEYGPKREAIQRVGPSAWLVDGSTSLEDVNYELDMELDAEGADRIAGWAAAVAEHLPRAGEVVEAQGCRLTVQRVRKQRVLLVLIEKVDPPPGGEEEAP